MRENPANDIELLAAWSAGCRTSGETLIERYLLVVHRFFRTKVQGDVEDLVQQTFLGCLEARERYQGHASFKTFLLAIARHQLLAHYRRARKTAAFTISSLADHATSPTGSIAKRQDQRLLADAFQRVSLDAQLILELAYWEGLDGSDIARVLDVPLNTAYSRLHRAKQALRARLQELAPDREELSRALQALASIPDGTRVWPSNPPPRADGPA